MHSVTSYSEILADKIGQESYDLFLQYVELLRRWSSIHNLMSQTDLASTDLIALHALDAFLFDQIMRAWKTNASKVIIDIGAGNGINGILLAILSRDNKIYMLERKSKIVSFLEYAKAELSLQNAFCIECDIAKLTDLELLNLPLSDVASPDIVLTTKAFRSLKGTLSVVKPLALSANANFLSHTSRAQYRILRKKTDESTSFALHEHRNYYRNNAIILEGRVK